MEVDERTFGERVSDSVAKFGGSWSFIFTGAAVMSVWVAINTLPPPECRWDPYPFTLLNLFLSLIAAFQAPFILMAQKRCERKQDVIYRTLFREIKEIVEADLSLEYEIMEASKKQARDVRQMKRMLRKLNRGGGA